MTFEPWMLAAMEEEGIMDTDLGRINRVARYIVKNHLFLVSEEELADACTGCHLDINTFSEHDRDEIRRKVNELRR